MIKGQSASHPYKVAASQPASQHNMRWKGTLNKVIYWYEEEVPRVMQTSFQTSPQTVEEVLRQFSWNFLEQLTTS